MTDLEDLAGLDAIAQADLVRRREVTPLELVDAAIDRIERVDPVLNAVPIRVFAEARERAARPFPDAPLAGVPFLVKDLGAEMAGVRHTAGSVALRDRVATADFELVHRYRAAGLVLLGRTSTPEFGDHSTTEPALFGPTRNPWDTTRTTGGSSGGSAAAVAAGMVPAAHGTDGAGSIRIPASCCGLFGLKTTRGLVSRAPAPESPAGLSVSHAVTRSVRDSAAILDATSGPTPGDAHRVPHYEGRYLDEVGRDPGRLRIAWSVASPLGGPVEAAPEAAARETVALLASLGHELEEAAPELDPEVVLGTMGTVWAIGDAHDWRGVERWLGRPARRDELEETTWELVEYGRRFSALDLLEALAGLDRAARAIAPFFERFDAWVTPTLAREPLPLGVLNRSQGPGLAWWRFDCSDFNPWNPLANITGQPSMSLPLSWSPSGLPVGTLVTGRFADEATLFRLAGQLEAARPWAARRPPVWAGAEG